MNNRLPKDDKVEKRKLYFNKTRNDRFCGYCGKTMFVDLNGFLLHINLCEVKDKKDKQPALI